MLFRSKGNSTNIYPGEKLKLNNTQIHLTYEKTGDYHVVEKGESLWDIARLYKVSITEIVKWNGLQDTKVKVGDRLKIKPD